MKIWDKLDEVLGAGMLTGIAIYALHLGINGGVVEICATGITALLMAKTIKNQPPAL